MLKNTLLIILITILFNANSNAQNNTTAKYDIVIYTGTSAGVTAAIQAARMGNSVLIIEPSNRLGGQTTGGLGQIDIGNKHVIGGISKEFYQNIDKYYKNQENWKWQKPSDYHGSDRKHREDHDHAMWDFEPSAALKVYQQMLKYDNITIVFKERLNRKTGVKKANGKIISLTMESGKTFTGKMFIDASYEGDLMASTGISYTVGRESNTVYGEKLNGIQTDKTGRSLRGKKTTLSKAHNFVDNVDPYIKKGDPKSGLLPFIEKNTPGETGSGDKKIQAYCFRMCLTNENENKISFPKPEHYNELDYELLFRNFEAGYDDIPWINSKMPNKKTDTNNKGGFSTDFIGQNYEYPEASYQEREVIFNNHLNYQKGLMWTLANHDRVPQKIRDEVSKWGTCKDEFERKDGWPQQLYIREARRMISDVVMTEKHSEGLEKVHDGIAMASYTMDTHHAQRFVTKNGSVWNEGNVEAGVHKPFPISYRSIIPKKSECTNLLVPVCLSASHIAFGSIRMEPVFMILGQSAATAASIAIKNDSTLQDVDYNELKKTLLDSHQILD